MSELDSKYDKMVDAASNSTREADPYRYLGDIEALSKAPE